MGTLVMSSAIFADGVPGHYGGYSAKHKAKVSLVIEKDGDARCILNPDRGSDRTVRGSYNSGTNRVSLGNWVYSVRRSGNDLILQNVREHADRMSLRRTGWGSDTNGNSKWDSKDESWGSTSDRPPTWSVGRFRGKRWDGRQMVISVDSDGRAVADYVRGSELDRISGTFRNSRLYLGRDELTIRRITGGIKVFLVGTKSSALLYRF
jgi:hypothetical protein